MEVLGAIGSLRAARRTQMGHRGSKLHTPRRLPQRKNACPGQSINSECPQARPYPLEAVDEHRSEAEGLAEALLVHPVPTTDGEAASPQGGANTGSGREAPLRQGCSHRGPNGRPRQGSATGGGARGGGGQVHIYSGSDSRVR